MPMAMPNVSKIVEAVAGRIAPTCLDPAVLCVHCPRNKEVKPASISAELGTQEVGTQDHLLLMVIVVIHGMPVYALVDSGASRSFVSDELKVKPPLHFVGAYSLLELMNGETIVFARVAPRVLVCIGEVQCWVDLAAIPLMEGVSMILGKD